MRVNDAFEALPDAVSRFAAVRDDAGEIIDFTWTYANPAAARATRYEREALIGARLLAVFPGLAESGIFEEYKRVVETGEAFSHPALWHDGTWGDGNRERRAFGVRATKSDDGFVVIYHEVTDDLIPSQQLRDVDASRFALMAAVTHDLRTPLAGIVGLSWLLDSDWETMTEETRREYVRDIVRSGEDLDRRITSALEHLKCETGRYEVDLEVCDVGEELAGAIDRMALMLESHRIVFDVPDDTLLWADRAAFARVAENLLSNAVKYSPEGTNVTVRAERVESAVVVSVIDEGLGISEEDAQRVFQQFERLDSGRRVAHGNGVGLSAVRQLVELMDGKVWVEPNAGRGSAFRFALPLAA
jgi:signal transduction histidine kinase